jgi:hypothetical protein
MEIRLPRTLRGWLTTLLVITVYYYTIVTFWQPIPMRITDVQFANDMLVTFIKAVGSFVFLLIILKFGVPVFDGGNVATFAKPKIG